MRVNNTKKMNFENLCRNTVFTLLMVHVFAKAHLHFVKKFVERPTLFLCSCKSPPFIFARISGYKGP